MRLLTVGEVARRAGVSPDAVRVWEKQHRLPAIRTETGRHLLRIGGPDGAWTVSDFVARQLRAMGCDCLRYVEPVLGIFEVGFEQFLRHARRYQFEAVEPQYALPLASWRFRPASAQLQLALEMA